MEEPKKRFSDYFYNKVTYGGVILALLVLFCELILFGLDFLAPSSSSYLGIFTYILLPPFLILGLVLIPLGARWKQERVAKNQESIQPKVIYIDPTNPRHQNALLIFIFGTVIILIMTAIGSYKAFHYTESVQFCGTTCHGVMKPEYTSFLHSPHARVDCVQCHIGSGADNYIKSKINGARQVYKLATNSYTRPIPTPIHNLRPAKETCEKCHWPGKSFSAIELKRSYFSDSGPSMQRWNLRMLMHVGGKSQGDEGIHAHMYNDNEIYYATEDEKRQKISWVKSVGKNGEFIIYTSKDSMYKDKEPPSEKIRKMDCLDCHSRPSHRYEAPEFSLNTALAELKISQDIPKIKSQAIEVLTKPYQTEKEAFEKIPQLLREFYLKKYPDYLKTHEQEIQQAADVILKIYKNNFFPEMKVRWDQYNDNIGHMVSPGCFRCHDNDHKSSSGVTITRDCKICHQITQQGPSDASEKDLDGLEFKHPFDDDGSWKEMNCSDCHTGGG